MGWQFEHKNETLYSATYLAGSRTENPNSNSGLKSCKHTHTHN